MRLIKILMSAVLVSALLMSSAIPACADADVLEKDMIFRYMRDKRFTSSGTKLPYRMYVPEDYDEAQEYPLVVFFHGAGERGNDNRFQVIYPYSIVSRLLTEENRENYKCIIIAPQCATGFQWVDTPWSKGSYSIDKVPESEFMKATVALIESVKQEYSVAEDRIYVTGISMGGFGTWDIISRHEELFAAAIPICGGGDPSYAEVLKDMPIWTFHGSADTSVPVEGTREMAQALMSAGSDSIHFTEYENEEHNVWNKAYVEDDLVSWLFEQTRASLVFDASYRANEGGQVSLPEKVPYGESITITITPDAGFDIEKVVVNGVEAAVKGTVAFDYIIKEVNFDVEVDVTFSKGAEKPAGGDKNEISEKPGKESENDGADNSLIFTLAGSALAVILGTAAIIVIGKRKNSKKAQ